MIPNNGLANTKAQLNQQKKYLQQQQRMYASMTQAQQRQLLQKQREYERQVKQYQRMVAQQQRQMANVAIQSERQMLKEQHMLEREQRRQMKDFQKAMHVSKLTKSIAEQYIAQSLGIAYHSLQFTRILEEPSQWKHACVRGGVMIEPVQQIFYAHTPILYTLCQKCGVVHYYFEGENSEVAIPDSAFYLGQQAEVNYEQEQQDYGKPRPYNPDGSGLDLRGF